MIGELCYEIRESLMQLTAAEKLPTREIKFSENQVKQNGKYSHAP